jgi:hypothetical protein
MKKHTALRLIIKLLFCNIYLLIILFANPTTGLSQSLHYNFQAELIPNEQKLNVTLIVKVLEDSYISTDKLYVLLKDNFRRDRNSDYQKTWLESFGPGQYFYKNREKFGFHNVKVSVNGQSVSSLYLDISEGLMSVKLPESIKRGDDIVLQMDYEVFPNFYRDSYTMYEWYPVVLNNQEFEIWKNSRFTPFSNVNKSVFRYNLSLKLPGNYDAVINDTEAKQMKDGDFKIVQSAGETDDLAMVALINGKRILKGNIRYYGERVPYTYIMMQVRSMEITKMEEDLQRIFGHYKTYVGAYPYKQIILIESEHNALYVYSGKEITEIGDPEENKQFYQTLVRQIGRVWLGERVWQEDFTEDWYMDGLVEFFTEKYFRQNTGDEGNEFKFNPAADFEPEGKWLDQYRINYLRRNPALQSENLTSNNCLSHQYKSYAVSGYLAYMEMVAGEVAFSNAFKVFLNEYNGKTTDFPGLIQFLSKELNTDFKSSADLLVKESVRLDYTIQSVNYDGNTLEIRIQNKGNHPFDFPIVVADKSGKEIVQRVEGFEGMKTITMDVNIPREDIKIISIDPHGMLADQNRENNHYFFDKKFPKCAPLQLRFGGENNSFTKDLFGSPAPLYNDNNKFMLGVLLANTTDIIRHFKWYVMPSYSFSTKKWVGQGRVSYDVHLDNSGIERLQFMTSLKSYDFNRNTSLGYSQMYIKTDPSVGIQFRNTMPGCNNITKLRYRYIYINEQYPVFTDGRYEKLDPENIGVHRIEFEKTGGGVLSPYTLTSNLEYQKYDGGFTGGNQSYLKWTAAIDQRFGYNVNKFFYVRLFGSAFLHNTQRNVNSYANNLVRGTIALIHQGFNDYLYDEYFASRQNQGGSFSSQVSQENGGGFKTPLGSAYSIGMSNNMAFSFNISTDLPFNIPWDISIRPYFDAGAYSVPSNDGMQMKTMWNGGISISSINSALIFHFPLIASKELRNTVRSEKGSLYKSASFIFNMGIFAPIN